MCGMTLRCIAPLRRNRARLYDVFTAAFAKQHHDLKKQFIEKTLEETWPSEGKPSESKPQARRLTRAQFAGQAQQLLLESSGSLTELNAPLSLPSVRPCPASRQASPRLSRHSSACTLLYVYHISIYHTHTPLKHTHTRTRAHIHTHTHI